MADGESDTLEGWQAYAAALNEGRAQFNPEDDKGFGGWCYSSKLEEYDGKPIHPAFAPPPCGPLRFPNQFTAKRKAAYEHLHPETRVEETRNGGLARQVGDPENSAPRFTSDTAAKTGKSERNVQREAERGEKVSLGAMALIKGTDLDTGRSERLALPERHAGAVAVLGQEDHASSL